MGIPMLTHWGWVTHICVRKLTIIGSDNGLSPDRHQAIIRTNAGILLIETLRTNFSGILTKIHTFSFKKIHLKMSAILSGPQCGKTALLLFPEPRPHQIQDAPWRAADVANQPDEADRSPRPPIGGYTRFAPEAGRAACPQVSEYAGGPGQGRNQGGPCTHH